MTWQTTTSYLKAPPPGYLEPAVDVYGELDNIVSNLAAGTYSNEYALEWAIYRLLQTAHDGHSRYTPTLMGAFLRLDVLYHLSRYRWMARHCHKCLYMLMSSWR